MALTSPPSFYRGYLPVITAAILWASSGTAGKVLFHSGVAPVDLVQARLTLATVALGGVFLWRPRGSLRIRWTHLPGLALHGIVVMSLVQLSYFLAISRIHVAAAIFLQYLAPVLVAVFSVLFWKERLTRLKALALFLSIGGCYLVVGAYNLHLFSLNKIGILWGLISALTFAATSLLSEFWMHRYRPWTVLFYTLFFAAIALNTAVSPLHFMRAAYTATQILAMLYVAVFGTLLPFGLYLSGINYIRSTRAVIAATLEPISAAVFAYFLAGEVLECPQIFGGLLVVVAVFVLQLSRERDEMTPQAIRTVIKTTRQSP